MSSPAAYEVGQTFYRFVASSTVERDIDGEPFLDKGLSQVNCDCWEVVAVTPKGAWLALAGSFTARRIKANKDKPSYKNHCKLVFMTSRKKFAYPSKGDAWISFKARCRSRLDIAKVALLKAQAALALSEGDAP